MARGIPLDDSDRTPWLAALQDLISSSLKTVRPGVLACSALDGAIPEINPKIVQEQLGHSSINLTLDTYSHVIKSIRGIAANALEDVVGSD